MNTAVHRSLIWVVRSALLILVVLTTAHVLCPGLPGLILTGSRSRSPYCSAWQALADGSAARAGVWYDKKIGLFSKRIESRDGLELWRTPLGDYWVPGDGSVVVPLLAQQERGIYGDATWGVHPGDIVLDCGAHVGVYVKKALAAGAKLVVAIEPTPAAVECLHRNLAPEIAAGKVIVYPKGVWDHDGFLTLYSNGNGEAGNSFVAVNSNPTVIANIPVARIDSLVAELKLPRVDFIKADIKGATLRMLAGAAASLRDFHPRFALSTEEPPEDPKAVADWFRQRAPGYAMRCGPCLIADRQLYTDVLFFH